MIELQQNDIHLWFTQPQNCTDQALLTAYKSLLTEKETQKQQRYVFDKDKHDALITRAFVRDLLSHYVDKAPTDWRFSKGEKDKPEIINPELPLRFNISHTQHLIICAVTLEHDIGCDVENTARASDVLSIADRYFSKNEVNAMFSLTESQQIDRFFDYWTLKESYIKAWGQGLAIPLDEFSFHIGNAESQLLNTDISLTFDDKRNDNPLHWSSWLLYPNEQHRVAISIRNALQPIDLQVKERQTKASDFNLRYFESVPLVSCKEVSCKEVSCEEVSCEEKINGFTV